MILMLLALLFEHKLFKTAHTCIWITCVRFSFMFLGSVACNNKRPKVFWRWSTVFMTYDSVCVWERQMTGCDRWCKIHVQSESSSWPESNGLNYSTVFLLSDSNEKRSAPTPLKWSCLCVSVCVGWALQPARLCTCFATHCSLGTWHVCDIFSHCLKFLAWEYLDAWVLYVSHGWFVFSVFFITWNVLRLISQSDLYNAIKVKHAK